MIAAAGVLTVHELPDLHAAEIPGPASGQPVFRFADLRFEVAQVACRGVRPLRRAFVQRARRVGVGQFESSIATELLVGLRAYFQLEHSEQECVAPRRKLISPAQQAAGSAPAGATLAARAPLPEVSGSPEDAAQPVPWPIVPGEYGPPDLPPTAHCSEHSSVLQSLR